MKNIIELGDDLEMLKSQMDILTRVMSDKNLITDDMIRDSIETRMERITPNKLTLTILLLVSGILFPGVILYLSLVGHYYSLGLGIFTILMGWFGTYEIYERMGDKTMDMVHDGSLLEVSESVTKMRQTNNRNKLITYIFMLVWCSWWIFENYSELTGSIENIIMVTLIFVFVIVGVTINFSRIERTTRQVLKDIERYK